MTKAKTQKGKNIDAKSGKIEATKIDGQTIAAFMKANASKAITADFAGGETAAHLRQFFDANPSKSEIKEAGTVWKARYKTLYAEKKGIDESEVKPNTVNAQWSRYMRMARDKLDKLPISRKSGTTGRTKAQGASKRSETSATSETVKASFVDAQTLKQAKESLPDTVKSSIEKTARNGSKTLQAAATRLTVIMTMVKDEKVKNELLALQTTLDELRNDLFGAKH